MASHHEQQSTIISGNNVYLNKNGQTIYHNRITKENYIITKDVSKVYNYCSFRLMLAFLLAYVLIFVTNNFFIGLFAGLLVWQGISFYFYKFYLPSLPVDNKFVAPKYEILPKRLAKRMSKTTLLFCGLGSIVMMLLLAIGIKNGSYEGGMYLLEICLALAFLVFFVIFIYSFILSFRKE